MLDSYDIRILAALQEDAQLTNAELSEAVNLSPSQCSRRVQRLRERGYIERTVSVLNAHALGLRFGAYVLVTLRSHAAQAQQAFHRRMRRLDEVQVCYRLTGDADYLVKVQTSDIEHYNDFLTEQFLSAPEVAQAKTGVILQEIKNTTRISLDRALREE